MANTSGKFTGARSIPPRHERDGRVSLPRECAAPRQLLVAEKPSQGRALAEALLMPGRSREEENGIVGWMPDGSLLACVWAAGHLLEIASPEEQNPAWARFCWDDLPLLPPGGRFRYACVAGKERWLRRIRDLAQRADEITNACDAGREGELIFAEIMGWCALDCDDAKVTRLWIADTTAVGLRCAWQQRRSSRHYTRMRVAAHARAEADWIWGISGTRMVTLALPPPTGEPRAEGRRFVWPVGRVQTPVLALIENRCLEIANFRAEAFWRMEAEFRGGDDVRFRAWLVAPADVRFGHTATHFRRSPEAREIRRILLLEGESGWQVQDTREAGTQAPPPLFDLLDLQRSANRIAGWSAAYTLQIAQRLYERDHAISYPRTDSAALPVAMRGEIIARYAALWRNWAVCAWPRLAELPPPTEPGSEHFNDAGVTDHYAIVPTGVIPAMVGKEPGRVRPERQLWELIAVRFLLAWLPPARVAYVKRTLVRDDGLGGAWRALLEAEPVESPGWLAYEDAMMNTTGIGPSLEQRLAEKSLPPAGATAWLRDLQIELGHTSPPHYFNDDLLLQKMSALRLGTSATRAQTIEGLGAAGLIERGTTGGRFVTTRSGAQLVALLTASPAVVFTDAGETVAWERQLELVERRREPLGKEEFIAHLVERLRRIKAALLGGGIPSLAFCPNTGRPVGEDASGWIFPPKSRLAGVRCPKVIAQRPMSAGDYGQILLGGAKGGGPFEGFVGRHGTFPAWLVFDRKRARFVFRFKARKVG